MKTSNFKKLSRQVQKEIKGSLQMQKCRNTEPKCDPGTCCTGGFCLPSPITECEPIF
ncbi:hypothetical protein [Chryseobacterium indologenes]|uniref:hypothetical protein n=1 Tax=Chryseobacterium indologenes TaxID=253 RepID=UPI00143EA07B|nr:hypothetical protein [Chryseobacterium indologenes]QIX79830.1 hypothetical protein FOB56_00515 [Chryseobacterium indologenes]UDQ53464.1 hypothetical protein LJF28_18800 [Chryseobacterium indologenes]